MKKILFLLFSLFLMVSCASSLPKQFTALADKVEKQGASFSNEQWEQANAQFNKLMEKYDKVADKLKPEQKKEISSSILRYQAASVKASIKGAADAVEGIVEGAKEVIDSLTGE